MTSRKIQFGILLVSAVSALSLDLAAVAAATSGASAVLAVPGMLVCHSRLRHFAQRGHGGAALDPIEALVQLLEPRYHWPCCSRIVSISAIEARPKRG